MRLAAFAILAMGIAGCGSSPPPPAAPPPEPPHEEAPPAAAPVVSEELGSIDNDAVDQTFQQVSGDIATCLNEGRTRVSAIGGDVTVFMRIDATGHVKYGWFTQSALGDRMTEKCLLDVMNRTTWPKPIGGEAEVKHGFGWDSGSRAPVPWESEKVTFALDASQATRRAIDQCKKGTSATIDVTGYVSAGPPGPANDPPPKKGAKKPKKKKAKGKVKAEGHFRAIGASSESHEAADKIDCVLDALRPLPLPSPGSSTAKVTFTL